MARIQHLHEHTDPDDLLPADQYLLDDNIDAIATWTVTQRHIWTAEFEALLGARQARNKKRKRCYENLCLQTVSRPRCNRLRKTPADRNLSRCAPRWLRYAGSIAFRQVDVPLVYLFYLSM